MDRHAEHVVLEIAESDFFLSSVSKTTDCTIRLIDIFPRSDGSALQFIRVFGVDPASVHEAFAADNSIREVRKLSEGEDDAHFEIVSETSVAMALADHGSVFTSIEAHAGTGHLEATIPPHVDASTVIDAFCSQYPNVRLVRRTPLDETNASMTPGQYRTELLSALTERQRETLRMAHATDYFSWPRPISTEELGERLGITSSTASQHLRLALGKLLEEIFETGLEHGDVRTNVNDDHAEEEETAECS